MANYTRKQARDWAWANMRGVANVVNPTFTADLTALNEKAIRYDVRKEIEYGFWGALLVAETATTPEEYIRFTQWAADEARGKLHLIFHASFNTLAQNVSVAHAAQEAGAELVLLAYPANFYARSSQDVYDYTKAFCDQIDIGVILFPVPLWGFERIHPAGMEIDLIRKLVDDVPNIVAIKAEGGMPTIGGFVEVYKTLGKRVIVTSPLEWDGIPLSSLVPIQFMGTSNYEFYGPTIPKMFALMQEGEFAEAMKLFWKIHPARLANLQAMSLLAGSNFLHRMLWKYQGWLQGFNGGPLRQPTMRLVDRQLRPLRAALEQCGLNPWPEPDGDFFVGRNPA